MENSLQAGNIDIVPQDAGSPPLQSEALRCSICTRRLGKWVFFVEETGDVPEPKQSWALCSACNEAVHGELERSTVQSPLRLRIAVGMVASERTPQARRANFGQMSDAAWIKLFGWLFFITMIVHLVVVVLVAGINR